ncbi:PIG-L deacetylase family protein [Candidatus Bipolaricaulota bacterium]
MKILYVFPHPDDESFGPARAISAQVRASHEVHLLTLTRGGATKERHRLGYSIEEMGAVRFAEMQAVAKVLGLADLTVLDLPDSGLKELDPRVIEAAVASHIQRVRPAIVVTYPVHGISGFHDHLVTHAVVKRVFVKLRDDGANNLHRLAFVTLTEEQAKAASGTHHLSGSTTEEIDCVMVAADEDMDAFRRALDCYVTYREMIERTGVRDSLDRAVAFEIFGQSHDPPLDDLTASL